MDSLLDAPRVNTSTKISWSRVLFAALVISYLVAISLVLIKGASYYMSPLADRAHHPLHDMLKPSGTVGRPLGIVGTLMMGLSFLYSLRKKSHFLRAIGSQSHWLQFHIFLGLAGPFSIVIHTGGKISGLAAVGFYSMLAMVFSGIFGRYLYSKIPRTRKGSEMSLRQIEQEFSDLAEELSQGGRETRILSATEDFLSQVRKQKGGLLATLGNGIADDLGLPLIAFRAWRITRLQPELGLRRRFTVARLILEQRRLLKRLAVLEASQQLLSYWHVFHKPFTVLASVVICLHIGVATFFGYGLNW